MPIGFLAISPRFLLPLLGLLLVATATASPAPADPADTEPFASCIERLQQRSRAEGISEPVVTKVLGQVSYSEQVIELDRRQPEFAETFTNYLNKRVSQSRIDKGRELLQQHHDLLMRLQETYGVQAQYLLSFWGLETNYGGYTGNLPVLDSLATLACDPRRSNYFTSELMAALKIVDAGVAADSMLGSWAGAMGQTQFMPSVYRRYARDGDGDGKIDLWHSTADALTSAAAFLQDLGWQAGWRWGREVTLPAGFAYIDAGRAGRQPLDVWRQREVRTTQGALVADLDVPTTILVPSGHEGPAFAAYPNFDVILRWNRSNFYAIAVGHLADRINGAGPLQQAPPADAPRLTKQQVQSMQTALNELGFDAGEADGVLGSGTRAAIRRYQQAEDLVPDGFPGSGVLIGLGVEQP